MFVERILSHKLFCLHSQATKETFNTARVLIGPANRAWGDVPYTLQPGLCGIEGDYNYYYNPSQPCFRSVSV